jgi:tRNA threonylcarbamoyladenosine biosynthesis protein TsaB
LALILSIETATTVCSVALARDGKLLSLKETSDKNSHSSVLTLFIDEVIQQTGLDKSLLDAVAVSEGPGSYTGLRIGVATAKGICYALDKVLIAVPTLQAMAVGMYGTGYWAPGTGQSNQILFCPMLDARRMEVYSALFDHTGKQIRETRAEIINENSFAEFLNKQQVVFAGDGAGKCKAILEMHPNAVFMDVFQPSAKYMMILAEQKYARKEFEDIAYFEPFYLKDFVAGKPRVKGLK